MKIGFISELNISDELVMEFYKENWTRPVILSDKKFYNWLFKSEISEKYSCLVAYDEAKDRVAGVMGVNERVFYLKGDSYVGGELTTWIISKDYRRSGAALGIIQKLQEKFEFLIGMGITNAAIPVYLRNGFRYVKHIPRYIKILDFNNIKDYCEYSPLALKLIKKYSGVSESRYEIVELSKGVVDNAFYDHKKTYNLFSRDYKNISWRYDEHPYFRYQKFAVKSGGRNKASLVVVRVQNIGNIRIMHIVDIIGNEKNIPAVLAFLGDFAKKQNVNMMDFYCTSSAINKYFVHEGWFSSLDSSFIKIPHLFSPIELREPTTTSLIYWSKNYLLEMSDISKLYITKQDADLDRPTLDFIDNRSQRC